MIKYKPRTIVLIGDYQKQHAIAMVQNAPIDAGLEVVLRSVTKQRNNDQNALMWACLNEISMQVFVAGKLFSADAWHEHLKQLNLPDETSEPYIFELVTKPESYQKWELLPSGDRRLAGSTTDLTKHGFSEYIEKLYAFASEHGVMFTERIAA